MISDTSHPDSKVLTYKTESFLFKMKRNLLIIIFVFISYQPTVKICKPVFSNENILFSTWEGFEADKLASIWLIQKFIAPGASIAIFPKGKIIKEGIQFDTPHSHISRQFNASTYESLMQYYNINNLKLLNIGKLIHDIEINIWERKVYKKSGEIENTIIEILDKYNTNEEIIRKSNEFFDRFFSTLTEKLESAQQ